jgi:hypothetical protein
MRIRDANRTRKATIKYPYRKDNPADNPNQPPVISIVDGVFLNDKKEKIVIIVTMEREMKILTSNHVFRN